MARKPLTDVERLERQERSERLVWARQKAGYTGAKTAAGHFGWNENTTKAHENGRNGFSSAQGDIYADAYGVSRKWLYLNIGSPFDTGSDVSVRQVPLLSKVSAGELMREDVSDEAIGSVTVANLPDGDWIALEVDGDSMDRISPPESKIIVNRRDKRLVSNACYVIADETGSATYKRWRPNPPRFEPVSTNPSHEPMFYDQEPGIVGRVKISILEM